MTLRPPRRRAALIARHERILDLTSRAVYYHMNGECKCDSLRYVYVPESWFMCRFCGGGWRSNNGCRHKWKLTV